MSPPATAGRLSHAITTGLCLAGTAAVGWLDYVTGYELSVFPLYALPAGLLTWLLGPGAGMLLALASGAAWWWVNRAAGEVFSSPAVGWANAAARTAFFLFVVLFVSHQRRSVVLARQQVRSLTGPIPMCTQCRRVCDAQGDWSDLDEFLRTHTSSRPVPKVCPDCARRLYASADDGVDLTAHP